MKEIRKCSQGCLRSPRGKSVAKLHRLEALASLTDAELQARIRELAARLT
jgi:hypothetical protein